MVGGAVGCVGVFLLLFLLLVPLNLFSGIVPFGCCLFCRWRVSRGGAHGQICLDISGRDGAVVVVVCRGLWLGGLWQLCCAQLFLPPAGVLAGLLALLLLSSLFCWCRCWRCRCGFPLSTHVTSPYELAPLTFEASEPLSCRHTVLFLSKGSGLVT